MKKESLGLYLGASKATYAAEIRNKGRNRSRGLKKSTKGRRKLNSNGQRTNHGRPQWMCWIVGSGSADNSTKETDFEQKTNSASI